MMIKLVLPLRLCFFRAFLTNFFKAWSRIASIVLVELLSAFLLSRRFGLEGSWWAYVANFVTISVLQGLYYQFVWKKQAVKKLVERLKPLTHVCYMLETRMR